MELLLNPLVKNFLIEKLNNDTLISQSLLFWGESDLGKLSTAKVFAKSILCNSKTLGGCNQCSSCKAFEQAWHPDFLLINTDSDTLKVKNTEPIFEFLMYKPQISHKKILIINNCEKLNLTTQSALLKELEEPKNNFIIILITSNPQKLLKTIKSRVIPIRFTKPNKTELIEYIKKSFNKNISNIDYLINLSQNRPAQIINFINNIDTLKNKENNINIFKKISKKSFIEQSSLIKHLLEKFEELENINSENEVSIKSYLKPIINDWLDYLESEIYVNLSQNSLDIKTKLKELKNTLQLLHYVDQYNANYRLLLETFCLTTF